MVELLTATKNILKTQETPEIQIEILKLQAKQWELENILKKTEMNIKSNEKQQINELKSRVELELLKQGYTLDEDENED